MSTRMDLSAYTWPPKALNIFCTDSVSKARLPTEGSCRSNSTRHISLEISDRLRSTMSLVSQPSYSFEVSFQHQRCTGQSRSPARRRISVKVPFGYWWVLDSVVCDWMPLLDSA